MKIYTKTGDDGTTGLFGGARLGKDTLRVEAIGQVDELNSLIGWARCACRFDPITNILERLQVILFELGADLGTPENISLEKQPIRISEAQVSELEALIDQTWAPLEPMRCFILPGGGELAARLHIARAVARRCERVLVALGKAEGLNNSIPPMINRLNDLLFALARRANQLEGIADIPWKGKTT